MPNIVKDLGFPMARITYSGSKLIGMTIMTPSDPEEQMQAQSIWVTTDGIEGLIDAFIEAGLVERKTKQVKEKQ